MILHGELACHVAHVSCKYAPRHLQCGVSRFHHYLIYQFASPGCEHILIRSNFGVYNVSATCSCCIWTSHHAVRCEAFLSSSLRKASRLTQAPPDRDPETFEREKVTPILIWLPVHSAILQSYAMSVRLCICWHACPMALFAPGPPITRTCRF